MKHEIKCIYCNKELPKIIEGSREICKCKKAKIEWNLRVRIQHLKKELSQLNKELSELKDKR